MRKRHACWKNASVLCWKKNEWRYLAVAKNKANKKKHYILGHLLGLVLLMAICYWHYITVQDYYIENATVPIILSTVSVTVAAVLWGFFGIGGVGFTVLWYPYQLGFGATFVYWLCYTSPIWCPPGVRLFPGWARRFSVSLCCEPLPRPASATDYSGGCTLQLCCGAPSAFMDIPSCKRAFTGRMSWRGWVSGISCLIFHIDRSGSRLGDAVLYDDQQPRGTAVFRLLFPPDARAAHPAGKWQELPRTSARWQRLLCAHFLQVR